ncbi:hypothetical protein H4S02_010879 [Coemansia sp. RSA 2611]|nr:hypothetical protein H4S02_010879 [Coemansia sp. RSA 2611]
MLMFTIGGDSNRGSMNAAEIGSNDDTKPNSLYGGSVRRQQRMAEEARAIALQDLSPSHTAVFAGDDAVSELDFGPPEESGPDSGFEEDTYVLEAPLATNLRLAECCIERASGRRENYYYTMGKKAGIIEPGGSGSAAGLAGMSNARRHAAADSLHTEIALKSASDLLSEIFPEGVPSQGELKRGARSIQGDVRFRAMGCQRPWHAFIVDDVLYVHVSEFSGNEHNFRHAVMALMELAEDVLGCASVIVALPRAIDTRASPSSSQLPLQPALDTDAAASLVRAFMYSGFELVPPMLYCPSPAYILVGYDAM